MPDLDDRLHNWGRAMRLRAMAQHCGSAEWRYTTMRVRLGEDEEEDRRRPRIVTDAADAALVESAWCKLPPHRDKLVLLLYYVLSVRDPWRLARFTGERGRRDAGLVDRLVGQAQAAIQPILLTRDFAGGITRATIGLRGCA